MTFLARSTVLGRVRPTGGRLRPRGLGQVSLALLAGVAATLIWAGQAAATPANTTPPTISGTLQEGQTLSTSTGSWSGTPPLTYTYQWQRCSFAVGSRGSGPGQLISPEGVAVDSHGDIWVSDTYQGRLEVFNESGEFLKTVGSGGSGPGQIGEPEGIGIDAKGDVWVADWTNDRVEEFNETGEYLQQFGSEGSGDGQLMHPYGIVVDAKGDVWVTDVGNNRVEEFNEKGEYISEFGSTGSGSGQFELSFPGGLAFNSTGNVWVTDTDNNRAEQFNEKGEYVSQLGSEGSGDGQFSRPADVTVDASGNVWVVDQGNGRVEKFSSAGEYERQFGSLGHDPGQLYSPVAAAVDSKGDVWVADTGNNRVDEFSEQGEVIEHKTCADIAGATSQTYALTAPDVGWQLQATVTAQDGAGEASATTALSSVVEEAPYVEEVPGPPVATGTPSITGPTLDGQTLSASTGSWEEPEPLSYAYQWQSCDTLGEGCLNVSGATNSTYALSDVDVGTSLRVVVTATDAGGSTVSTSPISAAVTSVTNTSAPAITGISKDGDTLNASVGAWEGPPPLSYTYQWQRCNSSGGECANVSGATSSSYLLGHDDVGTTLRLVVTAANSAGSASSESEATATVAPVAPSDSTRPAISGAAFYGGSLGASIGIWSGTPPLSYSYQWQSCNSSGAGCADVSGASDSRYQLGSGDVGNTLRVVVTASNAAGSASVGSEATGVVAAGLGDYFQFGSEGSEAGQVDHPADVVVDSKGDLWVVDHGNDRVEEFTETGEYLSQFGSTGSGNGELNAPDGIAVDSNGRVWVADTGNSRIEEFEEDGKFVRAVGSRGAEPGQLDEPEGVAVDAQGNVWVSDTNNGRLEEFGNEGGFLKAASSKGTEPGQLGEPADLAVDSRGDVWVADFSNDRIEEFNERGEYLQEFGSEGAGDAQLDGPYGIAVDSTGDVWVGDVSNNRVEAFTKTGEYTTQFGSEGSEAGQLSLTYPMGLAVDAAGDVWITDSATDRIEKWKVGLPPSDTVAPGISGTAKDGETLTANTGTWTGTAPLSYSYQWQSCNAAGAGCGNLAGATRSTYGLGHGEVGSTLRVVVTADNPSGSASATSSASVVVASVAPLSTAPPGVSGVPQKGTTLTASSGSWSGTPPLSYGYQWQRCNSSGAECVNISSATTSTLNLSNSDVGFTLRVIVTATNSVGSASKSSALTAVVGSGATFSSQFGSEGSGNGQLSNPKDVVLDSNGDLWVADTGNNRVEEFNQKGEYVSQFGKHGSGPGELDDPSALAIDSKGDIWVADTGNHRVDEFGAAGGFMIATGTEGAGEVGYAEGIAVDAHNDVWVSATYGSRVVEFNEKGEYVGQFGSGGSGVGQFASPVGIAIDAAGDPWVVDREKDRVEEFNGKSEYVSEFGSEGSGAGQFNSPDGIALDPAGNAWVADRGNDRLEEFNDKGEYVRQFGSVGSGVGQFGNPTSVAIDSNEDVWVTDSANDSVEEWTIPASNRASPEISGIAHDGDTLSASAGTWAGTSPLSYGYQWQSCDATGDECTNIAAATGQSYTLGDGDVETAVRVVVTATNGDGSAAATSQPSAVALPLVPSNATLPTISGTPQDGQILAASAGSWHTAGQTSYAYEWENCDATGGECAPVESATSPEYLLGRRDLATTLRVIVTATNAAGAAQAISAASSEVQDEPPSELQAPSTSGIPDVDQVLYASSGVWSGTGRRFSYQWESCDPGGTECAPIEGATGSEYDLAEGDAGSTLRVRIGADASLGALTDVSPATPVIGAAGTLANVSAPSISGTPQDGQPFNATPGSWSDTNPVSYAYQWQSCDAFGLHCIDIEGATGSNFSSVVGDIGSTVRVHVSASDEKQSLSEVSPITQPIAAAQAPTVERAPLIAGTPLQSRTLTATAGTWSGEAPMSYSDQWERCSSAGECAAIAGATASSYILAEADVGTALRVLVHANNSGGGSTSVSNPTAIVGPESLLKFSPPSISGVVQLGGTLSAEAGIWSGSGPVSYAYQWESCNPGGSECAPIEGAAEATYLIGNGDRGSTLRVKATVSNALGDQSVVSAPTIIVPGGELGMEQAEEVAQQADPAVLAPSTTATLQGQSVAPALHDTEEELASTGTLTSSTISKETPGEFGVNTPVGQLSLTPREASPAATTTPTIVNGTVALFANTSPATDTIVRPDALGATTILQLRSSEAPTSFSWEAHLGADQELEQLPDGNVAVVNAPEAPSGAVEEQQPSAQPKSSAAVVEGQPETTGEQTEREHEEAQSASEEAAPLEPLPAAPLSATSPAETKPGQLQPQDTESQYRAATNSMASSEAQTANQTLMVIEAPQVRDGAGTTIPASLSVLGDTITLSVKPGPDVTFPIMAAIAVAAPSDKVSAERDPVHYGLADGTWQAFTPLDQHLERKTGPLHVISARLAIPYDTLSNPAETESKETLEKWLAATKHLKPYITLEPDLRYCKNKAKTIEHECLEPSATTYRARFTELFDRGLAEGVTLWGAWNEPDISKSPLQNAPGKAARYWQEAQSVVAGHCGSCRVVAGEFALTQAHWTEEEPYLEQYRATILHEHRHPLCHGCWPGRPSVWGIHDYHDVSADGTEYADKFKQFTEHGLRSPPIIISEAAVELENKDGQTPLGDGSKAQQEKAAHDFLRLHTASRHIERVYYFDYRQPPENKQEEQAENHKGVFDSGLVEALPEHTKASEDKDHGEPRPAYCVLAGEHDTCPPTVDTGESFETAIGCGSPHYECSVVVHGRVNPHGSITTYYFQYGPSTSYGHSTLLASTGRERAQRERDGEIKTEQEEASCKGVTHFRLVAENGGGRTYGADSVVKWACGA